MNKDWLSLSAASEILGVHPSTVRKWSDEGKLPTHLTDGGHRRYLKQELTSWQETRHSTAPIDIDQLLDKVLHAVRSQIQNQSLENESWYTHLDSETREHYRTSGRSLSHAILFHLASTDENPEPKAQQVGSEYALRSRKHNLSVSDAARAYLYFRKLVLEAILSTYQATHSNSATAWAVMLRRFNQFTDDTLLAIIASYDTHTIPKLADRPGFDRS